MVEIRHRGREWTGRKEWVEFYALMAVNRVQHLDSQHPITSAELGSVGQWALKQPASVGKEVARHLRRLNELGLGDVVDAPKKTGAWRLALPSQEILLEPSRETVSDWLRLRSWATLGLHDVHASAHFEWFQSCTRSIVLVFTGRIEAALQLVGEARSSVKGALLLEAITDLLELRFSWRQGLEVDEGPALVRCAGRIGQALRVRGAVPQMLTPDWTNLEAATNHLSRTIARIEAGPDISGLSMATNALGIIFRRRAMLREAEQCFGYSAALAIAGLDIATLQQLMFNLGHTLYLKDGTNDTLGKALMFFEVDREIADALNIGKDSAQAEILAGTACLYLGDVPRAREWLRLGREVVATAGSPIDQAGLDRLEARILWLNEFRQGLSTTDSKRRVRGALDRVLDQHHMFGSSGEAIRQDIHDLEAGLPPQWRPPRPPATEERR